MIDLIAHNLAPIMFASVMGMLLLGYPVAFTLAAGGLIFFVFGVELSSYSPQIHLFWPLLQSHPDRFFGGIMSNETLLAVPFFTFMGIILERSRMAEDLLDTIGQLFGPVRGGIAYAVVLVGALLGATTGVVAASVMAMGLISLPVMLRYNYSRPFATGTIAASGTLAQIVPPSLVLIVMADQLGRSVGDMYVGALYPSLMIIAAYCLYVFIVSMVSPKSAPAMPAEARTLGNGITSLFVMIALAVALYFLGYHVLFTAANDAWRLVAALCFAVVVVYLIAIANERMKLNILSKLSQQVIIVLVPPLALIFLVLGTIFLGIATPTEGGAMGASGALILALAKRRLDIKSLKQALDSTTKLSAFVMMILMGARVFSLTFYGINGNVWIEDLLTGLPGGEYGFLIVVTIIVFILGCFLDFFEIAFIMVPLLVQPAQALGIDLIWFGIILGINLQTSFLTPPFGFSLFYLRSVTPAGEWVDKATGAKMKGVPTMSIYKGIIPFIAIQAMAIVAVISFPQLVTHYKDEAPTVDPASVTITVPGFGLGDSGGLAPLDGDASGNDPFGLPPLGGDLGAPPAPAPAQSEDLSQPPAFN
ncbi:TRAP transporter large permease subunit [Martelella alba]|uniref:TRAP transporter large permease subunit n=1 Tax=Martelella alba TaxID=2590451 RepID=A0A506UFY6_9HYPH|nr:TRAP transporter large permease subunit [Martelella alba]TPW30817.1 TRAP transporter large permease subunit [Martelella alba]